MFTLKTKLSVILPAKNVFIWGYPRITTGDIQAAARPKTSPISKGEEHYFMEKEEEVGRVLLLAVV